jgi:hypothetical protein
MLFDLRGRGRRRTVQVIYGGLALILGGGLVFFGVGGTGVGLFNQNTNGGSGASSASFQRRLDAAERQVRLHPQSTVAWATLTQTRYDNANGNFDSNTGTFDKNGLIKLRSAARAWDRYVALNPKQVDAGLARKMTNAFASLNRPTSAVKAWEFVVDDQPSANAYANLAIAAYAANQTNKGDLASSEAIRRTPKDQRQQVKSQLTAAKTQAAQQAAGSSSGGSASPALPGG